MLRTEKGMKLVEVDDYKKGCLPDTAFHMDMDVTFKGETSKELIENIKNFFGVDNEAIELNACDEKGRIDISTLENRDADLASDYEIELWKEGKCTLYACIYTFYAYKCEQVEL